MATRSFVSPVTGTWAAKSSSPQGAYRATDPKLGVRHHAGNDLQAADGSSAVAATGGRVVYVGNNKGYQWNAVVVDDEGNAYRYATHGPLAVKVGQEVQPGDKIGTIDRGHLHFEVMPAGTPAARASAAHPGQFVSTQWWGKGKSPTADPAKFFGVEKGAVIAAGRPVRGVGVAAGVPPADIPDTGAPVVAAYTGGPPLTPAQQAAARVAAGRPPTLRKGDTDAKTGGAVTRLQQQLAASGFNVGAVDGKFGRQTEQAVRAAEKQYGLSVERPGKGAAGPQVQAALEQNAPRDVALPRQRPDPAGPGAGLSAGMVPIGGLLSGMGAPPPTGIGRSDRAGGGVPSPLVAGRPDVPVGRFPAAGAGLPERADLLTRLDRNRFDTEAMAPSVAPGGPTAVPTSSIGPDPIYGDDAVLAVTRGLPDASAAPISPDPNTFGLDRRREERRGAASGALQTAQARATNVGTRGGVPAAQQWSSLQKSDPTGGQVDANFSVPYSPPAASSQDAGGWTPVVGEEIPMPAPNLAAMGPQNLSQLYPRAGDMPPIGYGLRPEGHVGPGEQPAAAPSAQEAAATRALMQSAAAGNYDYGKYGPSVPAYARGTMGGAPSTPPVASAPDGGSSIGSLPSDVARGWGVIGRGIGDWFSGTEPAAAKSAWRGGRLSENIEDRRARDAAGNLLSPAERVPSNFKTLYPDGLPGGAYPEIGPDGKPTGSIIVPNSMDKHLPASDPVAAKSSLPPPAVSTPPMPGSPGALYPGFTYTPPQQQSSLGGLPQYAGPPSGPIPSGWAWNGDRRGAQRLDRSVIENEPSSYGSAGFGLDNPLPRDEPRFAPMYEGPASSPSGFGGYGGAYPAPRPANEFNQYTDPYYNPGYVPTPAGAQPSQYASASDDLGGWRAPITPPSPAMGSPVYNVIGNSMGIPRDESTTNDPGMFSGLPDRFNAPGYYPTYPGINGPTEVASLESSPAVDPQPITPGGSGGGGVPLPRISPANEAFNSEPDRRASFGAPSYANDPGALYSGAAVSAAAQQAQAGQALAAAQEQGQRYIQAAQTAARGGYGGGYRGPAGAGNYSTPGGGGVPYTGARSANWSIYTAPGSSVIGGSPYGVSWSPSGYTPESNTPYNNNIGQSVDQNGNKVTVGSYVDSKGRTQTYTY